VKQGRRIPKAIAVNNPRPDEISEALRKIGIRSICHHDKKHPADFMHPGRIKFRLPEGKTKK